MRIRTMLDISPLRLLNILTLCLVCLWPNHPTHAADKPDSVDFIGAFSNFTYTEEHQYGEQLVIWQHKNTLVGIFSSAHGLAGDAPHAIIENVKVHLKSGKLSFDVTMVTGAHFCKVHENVPARHQFSFEGTIRKNAIVGKLINKDLLHPEFIETTNITLKRDSQQTYESYPSLEAWQEPYQKQIEMFSK